MRGCAFSLLLGLAGFAATAAAAWALLRYLLGQSAADSVVPGAIAGGLFWLAICLLRAGLQSRGEQRAVAAGFAGAPPADGRKAVLVGNLEPLGATLIAPFDGSPAVAYSYEVQQVVGSGKSQRHLVHYKGVGLAPSRLLTASGSYLLLAVPDFEGPPQSLSHGEMLAYAERYVAATTFQPRGKAAAEELAKRWNDDDGAFRSDVSYVGDEHPSLVPCTLTQHRVRPGEQVCLIGLYSAARGGLVPFPNWSQKTRLIAGDPAQAVATLGGQVKTRLTLAFFFTAAALATIWIFVASHPGHP